MLERIHDVFAGNGLITAFAVVGLLMLVCNLISKYLTAGRIHGSAIAIAAGLVLSYIGGIATGGEDGLADIALFSGMGPGPVDVSYESAPRAVLRQDEA